MNLGKGTFNVTATFAANVGTLLVSHFSLIHYVT